MIIYMKTEERGEKRRMQIRLECTSVVEILMKSLRKAFIARLNSESKFDSSDIDIVRL